MEIKDIKKIEKPIKTKTFEWYMTDWCNYQCPYCLTKNHKSYKLESTQYYQSIAEEISKKLDKDEKYVCLLKGGEVTFLNLVEILKPFKDYNIDYHITTNLSNTLEYYENLITNLNCKLVASFHVGCNKDEFIYKAKKLSEIRKLTLSFVIGETTIDYYEKVISELLNLNSPKLKILLLPLKDPKKLQDGKYLINKNTSKIFKDFLKKYENLEKPLVLVNNEKSDIVSMLDIPVKLPGFDPYGFLCTSKYIFVYRYDRGFTYHCCNKTTKDTSIICNKHNCNYCWVTKLELKE